MNSYNYWDYNPETRKVYDIEAEHGLVLADIYPYDDTDDIGRLMAAAPEMYRLLKEELIPTSDYGGILSFSREAKIRAVLACIDGKEEITAHEETN